MITVVCLGDSITQGYPYEKEASWVHILNENPQETFKLINAGINGHTTGDLLTRFDTDVLCHKPQMVIILAGTNDAWQGVPLEETQDNFNDMISRARKNNVMPVLGLITPIVATQVKQYFSGGDVKEFNEHLNLIRTWVKQYAVERHIPTLDFYSPMCIKDSGEGNPRYFVDGGHPNREGYHLMAESIYKELIGIIDKVPSNN